MYTDIHCQSIKFKRLRQPLVIFKSREKTEVKDSTLSARNVDCYLKPIHAAPYLHKPILRVMVKRQPGKQYVAVQAGAMEVR